MTEYTYQSGWKQNNEKLNADATALWQAHGVLPKGVPAEKRTPDIVTIAYAGDEPVGICTANIRRMEMVRSNMAFMRAFVIPSHREHDVARWILVESQKHLAEWAKENPELEVRGTTVILQSPIVSVSEIAKVPVWPNTDLVLVGFTQDDDQIRIAWFDHILFPKVME